MNFSITSQANRDLARLRAFLASKNPRAAREAIEKIVAAIHSLKQFPDRGSPIADGKRKLVVSFGKWGYNIEYIHLPELKTIVVRRIRAGLENPD